MKLTDYQLAFRGYIRNISKWLPISLAGALLAAPASAQQSGLPPWLRVAVIQVKGGESAEFADLMRDFITARREAGLPGGQVFQIVLGHPNEFHYVLPVQSIAENENAPLPMPPGQAATWGNRIASTTEHVHWFYAASYPDHGVQAPANAPTPTMILLRKIKVAQGQEAEYEDWVTDQYMPAFRQSDPLGHTMSRGVYGDSLQNFYHAYPLAGWEDLEGPDPLIEILGQRRYDQVFNAIDDIVVEHEMIVGRIRTDLMGQ